MKTNLQKHNALLTHFYRQLLTYMVVMLFLAFVNYMKFNGYWWVVWPAAGWGVALLLQALTVFFPLKEEQENR